MVDTQSLFRLMCTVFMCFIWSLSYAQEPELTIRVTNIKEIKGKLVVAIFDKKEAFLEEGKAYKNLVIDVTKPIMQYTIDKVQRAEYAIAVFHDKNSDGICNTNLLGIPREAYGFSNNFRPTLLAPKFEQVKLLIMESKLVEIRLIH